MTVTLNEVRSVFKNKFEEFETRQERRIVYLGDGRGNATSNLTVSANPSYVFARDSLGDAEHFFPVKLNRTIRPAFNLPVWVGKRSTDVYERILDIVEEFADFQEAASSISGLSPHRTQHEFGGGDEVFVDSQLIKEGLLKPRNPATSVVDVFGFYYFSASTWKYFSGSQINNMLDFVPTSASVYITVSLDTTTGSLTLTQGENFLLSNNTFAGLVSSIGAGDGFRFLPTPPRRNIPVGSVLLNSATTAFDWNQNGGLNNVFPIRMLITPTDSSNENKFDDIYSKINRTTLPTLGAANSQPDQEFNCIDGGRF